MRLRATTPELNKRCTLTRGGVDLHQMFSRGSLDGDRHELDTNSFGFQLSTLLSSETLCTNSMIGSRSNTILGSCESTSPQPPAISRCDPNLHLPAGQVSTRRIERRRTPWALPRLIVDAEDVNQFWTLNSKLNAYQ